MVRKAISEERRKALRAWVSTQRPKPSQKEAKSWFYNTYGQQISQSTISESLNARYEYLDKPLSDRAPRSRDRASQWPLLEEILYEWQLLIERKNGFVSGDILIEKARQIWPQIPQYQHLTPPCFSKGWLDKYKNRHNIKRHVRHGEAQSIPEEAAQEMRAIRTLCGEYNEEDIYNMDETGLYWRRGPAAGLASEFRPGMKRDKTRISIAFCTNFTGTDKLIPWFIGKAQRPHVLRNVNLDAMGLVWKANKKAWMTTTVMKEWLDYFYTSIGPNRKVLLLLDNFSAHVTGVELNEPPANIRIQWLPPNSTSHFQPLDQGIISTFKTYYRKALLSYMVSEFEARRDPVETLNLYLALRWCTRIWSSDVKSSTIYRCFRKARILPEQEPIALPSEPLEDLSTLYAAVQQAGRIQEVMDLQNFLNPLDENDIKDHNWEPSIEEIIAKHTNAEIVEEEEDEMDVELVIPTGFEALEAIKSLQIYLEHQSTTSREEVRSLYQIQRLIEHQNTSKLHQQTLDSYFR